MTHNHKKVVDETIKAMANTDKIKGILKTFPDDKRKEYVDAMKQRIVPSWYVNNCKDCSKEFEVVLTNWENGRFEEEGKKG